LGIPFEFNNKEYFEFVWYFERLADEKKREAAEAQQDNGRTSLSNMGINPRDILEMNKQESGKHGG